MTQAHQDRRNVLIVEDEWLLASSLATELEDAGLETVGPAATPDKALSLIADQKIDVAILDANLMGDLATEVAHALRKRGIPFLFLTGYSSSQLPEDMRSEVVIEKPASEKDVVAAVLRLLT